MFWRWWRHRWFPLTDHGWVREQYIPFRGWTRNRRDPRTLRIVRDQVSR